MTDQHFQHEHLRLSEGSIRLVQIHGSSSKTAPLSLRITQFATSKRPTYTAISYTWGSAGNSFPITINGKPFHIRPNLWHLLSHLRQRGESRFLFVDALCINQANITERNFHVQFMSRIYGEAELTIVWLGLPSDDRREARAIDFVVEMATHRHAKAGGASFRNLYLTDKVYPRWFNLLLLCRCYYWTRVWILQEVLQAKRIEVFCGTAQLEWDAFETVHNILKPLISTCSPLNTSNLPASLVVTLREILSTTPARLTSRRLSHTASTLQDLLHEFHDAQCTLRRDKVYGMLGIASDCGLDPATDTFNGPAPDYAKHVVEVYFDVLNYLRDTSSTSSIAPLTALLLQKSLGISSLAISHYATSLTPEVLLAIIPRTTLRLKPDYISTISATITNYTSPSDLRQRLNQFDWSPYVGFEILRPRTPTPGQTQSWSTVKAADDRKRSRPSLPQQHSSTTSLTPPSTALSHRRNSSSSTLARQVTQTAPLPPDLISNVVAVLESSPATSSVVAAPPNTQRFHIPLSSIIPDLPSATKPFPDNPLSEATKVDLPRSLDNISLNISQRPVVIIESSPLASPVRTRPRNLHNEQR